MGSPPVYATWNPSDKGAAITLSAGNLTLNQTTTAGLVRATLGKSTGKWYWEVTCTSTTNMIGIAKSAAPTSGYCGATADSWGLYGADGKIWTNNAALATVYATYAAGAVISLALDMDAGTLTLYKNGVSLGVVVSSLTGTIYPAWGNAATVDSATTNFGASPFAYPVPVGYNPGLYN